MLTDSQFAQYLALNETPAVAKSANTCWSSLISEVSSNVQMNVTLILSTDMQNYIFVVKGSEWREEI